MGSIKILDPSKFWVQNSILCQINLCGPKKTFWTNKYLGLLGPNRILGSEKNRVSNKNFGSEKMLVSKKMLDPKKNLGPKTIWGKQKGSGLSSS